MLTELTYKELYNILGEAIRKDANLGNRKALIRIGNDTNSRVSTVKGLLEVNENNDTYTTIQSAWYNGKQV